ncbi:MAG: hypothetical protein AB7E77_08300 [Desulfobulbus sp.]
MNRQQRLDQLEQALRRAHCNRPLPAPDTGWNQRVMNEIRHSPIRAAALPSFVTPLVWRFAAVTCSLAMVLSFYLLSAANSPDQMAMDLFLGDPLLSQALQILSFAAGMPL